MSTYTAVYVLIPFVSTFLARYCDHPLAATAHHQSRFDLDAMYLDTFPICPIAYRTQADGTPNGLGRKYERLVQVNVAMKSLLPPQDDPGYHKAAERLDNTELIQAMKELIGIGDDGPEMEGDESLLPLFWRAVISCDPGVAALARSCLLTVRLQARI